MLPFSGNDAKLQFYLNNYTDSSSVISAIRAIHYDGGNTNTTGGLRTMRLEIFDPNHGDRSGVTNLCILITDGVPTREVEGLQDEVNRVKAAGIRVIGVGVTSAVSDVKQILPITPAVMTIMLEIIDYEAYKQRTHGHCEISGRVELTPKMLSSNCRHG